MIQRLRNLVAKHPRLSNLSLLLSLSFTILVLSYFISQTYVIAKDSKIILQSHDSMLETQARILQRISELSEAGAISRARQEQILDKINERAAIGEKIGQEIISRLGQLLKQPNANRLH